jgi:hypothetical protein
MSRKPYTGPLEGDLDEATGCWIGPLPIPPERFPYCAPEEHEVGCTLREGGRFCDCAASDASDDDLSSAPRGAFGTLAYTDTPGNPRRTKEG